MISANLAAFLFISGILFILALKLSSPDTSRQETTWCWNDNCNRNIPINWKFFNILSLCSYILVIGGAIAL